MLVRRTGNGSAAIANWKIQGFGGTGTMTAGAYRFRRDVPGGGTSRRFAFMRAGCDQAAGDEITASFASATFTHYLKLITIAFQIVIRAVLSVDLPDDVRNRTTYAKISF